MKNRLTEWLTKPLIEDIEIPVEIGDTILTGRFKNKKTKVKTIGYNEKGDLLINNRTALKFRIIKSDRKLLPNKKPGKDSVAPDPDMRGADKFTEGKKVQVKVPGDIKGLYKLFKKNKKQLYIVGGAVRDAILGKSPKDFDLATDAKPEEVLKIAKSGGFKTYEVGKQFGVVVVGGHEIATFRKDIGKGRRPDAVDFSDIQGDVKRRDLTINALFYDIGRDEIVDITGGLKDLKNKLVRTVGNPKRRFDEDPLRKLRALRFQAVIGGKMDKDTEKALLDNPSLKGVSRERIREEFVKGIEKGKNPKLFMEACDKFGFTKQILPQLNIRKPYPNVKDYILFLAMILRKNDVSKLGKQLNSLKYSAKESNNIQFLVYLTNFKPENIYMVKKAQEKTTLTPRQIVVWGGMIGKDFRKLATFKLSVKGSDIVGLKGKAIGDKIKDLEKKKFLEMLNKPNYLRNQSPTPANQKDGEHQYYNPDTSKKKKKNELTEDDDKEPKFHSVHRTSTFDATFGRWYANYVPLSTKKIQSILGKEKVSVFHVGNAEYESDIKQVQRIVGKKGTLSTFTRVDKGEKLAKGKGIQSGGGIIYQIEGTLLVASTRDMQSMPDNTGRRWIPVQDLAGKVAGGKMYKELKSAIEKNKMDKRSWDRIYRKAEEKWEKENDYWGDYDGGWRGKEVEMKKIMGPLKRKWIKKYIDMGYKIINKYKPQIKRHILSQKDKPSQHGWNEILVNQIHVQDVFLLSRNDYPNIRKAAEKIAKGSVTVGTPAKFRTWYNKRGGIINEMAIPSPSRKGVEKMKRKGNTSVPYGSGYKKFNERAKQAVSGRKVHKNITGFNLTHKGRKYKEIDFETKKIDNKTEMVTLRILAPKKLFGQEVPVKFRTLRRGPFMKTDTSKKVNEDGKKISDKNYAQWKKSNKLKEQEKKIKKVIGIFGGRYQPFGPHHLKTFKWLQSKVDDAYITTSDIKKPPKHPMNYSEKVRHMVKMGVPKNKIIKEKIPLVAKSLLKKFDPETTAVVYIFGKKDAGRLKGGKNKSGKLSYFQDYNKNKNNLKGHEEHGYYMVAPHQSIKVGGQDVSGTVMRNLLGSPKVKKEDRPKLFKQAFGYFDKGVYNMMTNKFKKLFETFDNFIIHNDISEILKESSPSTNFPTDDGPPTFYDGFSDYKKQSKKWIETLYNSESQRGLGWELVHYILGKNANDPGLDYTTRMDKVPTVAFGRRGAGPYGERFPSQDPIIAYKQWIEKVTSNIDFKIVKWLGLTPDEKNVTGVPVEAPALPGVQTGDQNTQRVINLDLAPGDASKSDSIEDIKESFLQEVDLLIEGGAYGHMAHPFDDNNLMFSDLKQIIINGIGGKLDREDGVTEKLDGQNLMVSWIDGKLRAARNKGHLKNFGKTAPTTNGIKSMFSGRGNIEKAFVGAMKDLEKSIGSLNDKQKDKVFGNGKKWMNLEVMYPATANVIDYDVAEIIFHGTLEYDESGRPIGQPKDSARMLAGMIKQTNNHIQKMFKIGKPNFLSVPKHQDFGKLRNKFLGQLNKLQKQYALSDKDTLGMYHESFWREYIFNASKQYKVKLKPSQFAKLVKRWAYFDKGYKIPEIKRDFKDNPKFLDWITSTDKQDHSKIFKQNIKPFEILFFQVGAEILKNIQGYIAVSPDKSVQKLKKELLNALKDLKKPDKIEKLKKLKIQIEKLQKIGGVKAIVPSEGIVFKYKGNIYKFTGAFAPINQILGSLKFG